MAEHYVNMKSYKLYSNCFFSCVQQQYHQFDLRMSCIPFVIFVEMTYILVSVISLVLQFHIVQFLFLYSMYESERYKFLHRNLKKQILDNIVWQKRCVQRCIQVISTYTYTSQTCREFRPLNSEKGQSDTISYVPTVHFSNHSRIKPSRSKSIGFEQFFLY